MASVTEVVWQELTDAIAEHQTVKRVRISPRAIPGSPCVVPFAPERVKTLPFELEPWDRELLMHPEDWRDALLTISDPLIVTGNPPTLFGLDVVRT